MLQATPALAVRVERAEIDFCAAAARAGEPGGAASLEIAGGRALCGAPNSPFNKVLGLGLSGEVTDDDLDAIDDFYDARGVVGQIELCPLAPAALARRLNERGYVLHGFENELGRGLDASLLPEPLPEPEGLDVSESTGAADEQWIRIVSEGFAAAEGEPMVPPLPETTEALAALMRQFVHPEIARYVVSLDGKPAGAGASYVWHGVAGIVGTATVAAFRRRGAQTALVARAVNKARGRAELAVATTEPGSTSQRTFERLGFQVLYTRAILVRS
jgi:GNAT superfamily N-acetyltransferase